MPSRFGFEPRSPRYGPFLVLGLFDTRSTFRPFLAILGPFLGHIVELEGKKELLVTGQLCRNGLPLFGRFDWVLGTFWAKKGCFGAQNAQFWEGTSRLGAPTAGRHR